MKKAQVAIFLIIVVLLLFGFIFLMYVTGYAGKLLGGDQGQEIKNYVQDCTANTLEDGLILLGQQGGRITLKEPFQEELKTSILLTNQSHVPTVYEVEEEINSYIENNLKTCLDFSIFKGRTLVNEGNIKAKTTITKKDVTLTLDYPLTFQIGEKSQLVNDYFVQKDVGMLKIIQIITKIVNHQLNNNYLIPDNPMQEATNLQFRITAYEKDLLISIKDNNYLINNKPYEFVFAERY